jgi:hypothetical protein
VEKEKGISPSLPSQNGSPPNSPFVRHRTVRPFKHARLNSHERRSRSLFHLLPLPPSPFLYSQSFPKESLKKERKKEEKERKKGGKKERKKERKEERENEEKGRKRKKKEKTLWKASPFPPQNLLYFSLLSSPPLPLKQTNTNYTHKQEINQPPPRKLNSAYDIVNPYEIS